MVINNISASQYLVGKLRKGVHDGLLIDYNAANRANQFGQWIYPDRPKIMKLLNNKNNFPRVSVEQKDLSTIKHLGIRSTLYHDLVQIIINVWTPIDLICEITNISSEDHTYNTGTQVYSLDNLPVSVIGSTIDGFAGGIPYSFTVGTDYNLVDSNYDGLYDSIEWLGATSPDDGTTFTCGYARKAAGEELVRIIGQEIDVFIRENWLIWMDQDHELKNYNVTGSHPVDTDIDININRYEIVCTFKGITIGHQI